MRSFLFICFCSLCGISALNATDTAFWKPYSTDKATYLLLNFDEKTPNVKLVGNDAIIPDTKFGAGLKLSPEGALVVEGLPAYPNNTISIECWLKLERYPASKGYVTFRQAKTDRHNGFALWIDQNGEIGFQQDNMNDRGIKFQTKGAKFPLNKWTHLGVSSCGLAGTIIYLDGQIVGQHSSVSGTQLQKEKGTAPPLYIGNDETMKQGLSGIMDEFRIHTNVFKLWPRAQSNVQPNAPDSQTRWTKKNNPPISTKNFEEDGEVDGLYGKGSAKNVIVKLDKPLTPDGGAIDFWFKPEKINNYSDRNIVLVRFGKITAYLFNGGHPPRPLAFYFQDNTGVLRMNHDKRMTELHPGRWYHLIMTWNRQSMVMYIDGELAASYDGSPYGDNETVKIDSIALNPRGTFAIVDEINVYPQKLTQPEVANCFSRHVHPEKVSLEGLNTCGSLKAWFLPSHRKLVYEIVLDDAKNFKQGELTLQDEHKNIISQVVLSASNLNGEMKFPERKDGVYNVQATFVDGDEKQSTNTVSFEWKHFPWVGNELGKTKEVFPPFTPVKVDGETVQTVMRSHKMNGLGLWDSVVSKNQELLSAPITLKYKKQDGSTNVVKPNSVKLVHHDSNSAIFAASAGDEGISVTTTSTIDLDGMMKVEMSISPAAQSQPLESLWLEIPLKNSMVSLFHEDCASLRSNYAGAIKPGEGVLWSSSDAYRSSLWRNCFTGYLWLGGPERGLAWFAENDRGWITEKNKSKKPLQTIERRGDEVVMKIFFVNKSAVLKDTRKVVFGLQASPTKPMLENWRRKGLTLSSCGLPVFPWGGLSCAWKEPYNRNWEIVDKVLESKYQGKKNSAWFEEYEKKHNVPPVYGTKKWSKTLAHFSSPGRLDNPVLVYFEEMKAYTGTAEWNVYQDEWSLDLPASRNWPDESLYRKGISVNPGHKVSFPESYQNYGLYLENEWLKRGVSLYWDNTYLKVATNTLTTNAYVTEDGAIQPATTLWNQREYMKRTWNLLNHWRQKSDKPLEFCAHMTNTNLIPLFSWASISYDIEMSKKSYSERFPEHFDAAKPYPPDFLLTESTGQLVGNHPYLVHDIFQVKLSPGTEVTESMKMFKARREWGMRMVHEINRGGIKRTGITTSMLERALFGFGYGSPETRVFNYWSSAPAMTCSPDSVKWIVVARPQDKALLIVLQSWSEKPVTATLHLNQEVIGFKPGDTAVNKETGKRFSRQDGAFSIPLRGAYGMEVIYIPGEEKERQTLFEDDFNDDASLGWSYTSPAFTGDHDKENVPLLRFDKNTTTWLGPARIAKWTGVAGWKTPTLRFRFKVGKIPSSATPILNICVRGATPKWSRHGISHTRLKTGEWFSIVTNPKTNTWELRHSLEPRQREFSKRFDSKVAEDTRWHELKIAVDGPQTKLFLDENLVADFNNIPMTGNAFSIEFDDRAIAADYVDIADVTVTGSNDDSIIEKPLFHTVVEGKTKTDPTLDKLKKSTSFNQAKLDKIRKLLLFTKPSEDFAQLKIMCEKNDAAWNEFIKAKMPGIKERMDQYVEEMRRIGQPTPLLPEYKKTQTAIESFLRSTKAKK